MFPKCEFRTSSTAPRNNILEGQMRKKQQKDALINKSMRNADDLLKVAPRLRPDSADDRDNMMRQARQRSKTGFKKKSSVPVGSPVRAGGATFLTAADIPEYEGRNGNDYIPRPQT